MTKRLRAHVNDLSFLVRLEPTILESDVAQQHDDNFLSEVLRLSHLGQTFRRVEGVWRGKQPNGFPSRIRLPQGVFPTFTCPDVLDVEENVFIRPAVSTKPLFECNGSDVILAGMAYEEP